MIIPKLSGALIYGGDYNPEQWPESVWLEDVALMRKARVNLVSIAIFSWTKLQPAEDQWEFGWLDRILDLLAENGILACIATSTASPPAWLVRKHPSLLPTNADGQTLYPGSRQHYSPSSRHYQEAAALLVEKLGQRYASHPALAAWHINNEYACHMQECHEEESTTAFRLWLKNKYGSLDQLNEAWGAAFWSQTYTDWEEIHTPRKAPYHNNPTQQLDFRRFTSDAFLELLLMEKRILKAITPDIPVTTNLMGFFKPLDYHRWAQEIDFVSWDSYPDPIDEEAGRKLHAAGNDITRSLLPNTPFVLMEQATSAVNWREINRPKRPGLMRLWSLQTIARGGDGVMFFQWRASKAGSEKYHSAMVPHSGAENSRVFREVEQLGAELKRLAPVSGSQVQAKAAILFDWHAWWAVEVDSRPARIDYAKAARDIHGWFFDRNIAVDFISPNSTNLDCYNLLVAPSLYLLETADAHRIERFVEGGGTFLATYFSGIVDGNDHVHLGGYPAPLRKLLGLWVEEWCPYADGQGNSLRFAKDQADYPCDHWGELVHLEGAENLAAFASDFFSGSPAFTRNRFGEGHAFYLATRPDREGMSRVFDSVALESAKLGPALAAPAGVEVSRRSLEDREWIFLLNHSDEPQTIAIGETPQLELLSGKKSTGSLTLAPLDAAVLERPL